jgi:hypothetical protein
MPISLTIIVFSLAAADSTQQQSQPAWHGAVASKLTPELIRERDALLAQVDTEIRKGLLKLGDSFPQLKAEPTFWKNLNQPSQPGQVSIWLYHTDKGKGAKAQQMPPQERVVIMVHLRKPPDEPPQMGRMQFRGLGLFGQLATSAGDPQLDAALKKLVADAVAPLVKLEEHVSTPTTQPATTRPATAPSGRGK